MHNLIVYIIGTTASGKTQLSLNLCKDVDYEIISCDSMQLYKKADIMTAKATLQEQQKIKHHGLDLLELHQQGYNRSLWTEKTLQTIQQIKSQNKIPVLAGGTHYYIESILFKQELEHKYIDIEVDLEGLSPYDYLIKIDPKSAQKFHRNDERRIMNSIKFIKATNNLASSQLDHHSDSSALRNLNFVIFWPKWSKKENLKKQVIKRINEMLEEGGLAEIMNIFEQLDDVILEKGGILQSIGYKQFRKCYDYKKESQLDLEQVRLDPKFQELFESGKEQLIKDTMLYTKKQLQWIKNRILCNSNIPVIGNRLFKFEFDTAEEFKQLVIEPAQKILKKFIELDVQGILGSQELDVSIYGFPQFSKDNINKYQLIEQSKSRENWKKGVCEICNKEYNGPIEEKQHMQSKLHKNQLKLKKNNEQLLD